ncbi:MAG: ATP-binding cassette domain-containing protein [Proteobacteria bacterium]|nr:ATP-binding cassette domain-containing protein [Pseudomonadota bacterium]
MITLRNLTLRRGAKVLLDGTSVTIHPGEKAALVGRNGAGKSTLFALLNGTLHEDGGEFAMPAGWRIAQVAQHMPETDESATDFVLAGDTHLAALYAQLEQAEQAHDGMAIAQAHSDLADAGAHDARARAEALTLGLGFTPAQLARPVNSFSGGWRMRLQLARALMAPSDLLLLDEPTNHLDLDALVWLEGWLTRYSGTLVVISHDREFLDAVTQVTLHIEHQRVNRYGGNYSAFEELRAQQLALQQAAFSKQQDKIAHLQKFITRFKAKASKAKQAQSRVKALERMEKIAPVLADAEFQFEFKEPQNLPNPMLAIADAQFGYRQPDGRETVIVQGVNRSVMAGQRIGILGANGQGKSTFVKTVAHTLPLLAGQRTEGKGLAIGYFAQQELDVLHEDSTPLEHLVRLARELGLERTEAAREQQLRNFLGTFSFPGEMAMQPVGQFSGGEKARLVLAMLVWQRPNLLLLDEPTNHLDLATREALAVALNEFEGTLMLVSHDRALLRSVCDEFWLVADGRLTPFDGDLDDYQIWLAERARETQRAASGKARAPAPAPVPAPSPQAPPAAAPAPAARKEDRKATAQARQARASQTRPLRIELQQGEVRMASLATERADIEAQIVAGTLDGPAMADAGRRLNHIGAEVAMLEERWLELTGEIEAIEQG